MNRECLADRMGGAELADRLALTSRDRRLESMVLLEMLRSATGDAGPRPRRESTAAPRGDDGGDPGNDPTFAHARNLAWFLAAEYGLDRPEQWTLIAELAVELVQRMDEELPHVC